MLESLAEKLFVEKKTKRVKGSSILVSRINALESKTGNMTEFELRRSTGRFKDRIERGESLDTILPEAFAVVREAAVRQLGMRHFDVQLEGGIILHSGAILEMKTGEGKTLAATLPAYLNALSGNGVHIHTINDYLANRDFEWMSPIFRFLGITVGCLLHGMKDKDRKAAYACDITYGNNTEFIFDYLRDNMKFDSENRSQQGLHFAIIDEVDLALIDEARTPYNISGQSVGSVEKFRKAEIVVSKLGPVHYTVNEKDDKVQLTEEGIQWIQQLLNLDDFYESSNYELYQGLNNALKAHHIFKKDIDYLVENGEVVIIDSQTGRKIPGRRYSDGLHQALEAKEQLSIAGESETLATISCQNFYRLYDKLSGMSATADIESAEFKGVYKLDVHVLPTYRPMIREDKPDQVFGNTQAKYHALIKEVRTQHREGRPILIGTLGIESSEEVSHLLGKNGIRHVLLNAKNGEYEAEIVAQAGRLGAVTITTEMSGRGTDILLGGNPELLAKMESQENPYADILELKEKYEQQCLVEKQKVIQLGGLFIIGTERNKERRKDEHLVGRSGRQGDPGASLFIISLQDNLMRRFGSPRMKSIIAKNMEDDVPIEHKMVDRALRKAQKSIANRNFEIRKNLLKYDDVLDKHRRFFYQARCDALGNDCKDTFWDKVQSIIHRLIDSYKETDMSTPKARQDFFLEVAATLNIRTGNPFEKIDWKKISGHLFEEVEKAYNLKWEKLGLAEKTVRDHEKFLNLYVMDQQWKQHLANMNDLKKSISLGNKDPLLAYHHSAAELFDHFRERLDGEIVRTLVFLVPRING